MAFSDSRLRSLQSFLDEKLNARENHVLGLQKQLFELKEKEKLKQYTSLENNYSEEEKIANKLRNLEKRTKRLEIDQELTNQSNEKSLSQNVEFAEGLIESLSIKAKDQKDLEEVNREIKNEKLSRVSLREALKVSNELQRRHRELESLKQAQKETAVEHLVEQQDLRSSLRAELERQKNERKKLIFNLNQIGLLSQLELEENQRETLKVLREEELSLLKEEREKEKRRLERGSEREKQEALKRVRGEQVRMKEESKIAKEKRENDYLKLLSELLAEEDDLEHLREDVRRRKKMEHQVVARRILEERGRLKKEARMEAERAYARDEQLCRLRRSLWEEEEERTLLLRFVPHIKHLLTQDALSKLSNASPS